MQLIEIAIGLFEALVYVVLTLLEEVTFFQVWFIPRLFKFLSLRNLGGIISSSLQENGYVKFSNGIVLQWGKGKTFPVAFANKCLHVSATIDGVYGEGGHANDDIWVNSWSKTGYTTYRNSYKTKFFAIGY